MWLFRVQVTLVGQALLLKRVSLFAEDGVTLVPLFDPATNQPISNSFKTDASGFISFKLSAPQTLTFRQLTGLSLSPTAHLLWDSTTPAPFPAPIVETEIALPCAEMIVEGYAVKVNSLNQLLRCSATNLAHLNTLIGLAKQTGNIGDIVAVSEDEFMVNTAWAWVPDKPVFLGTNGTLTQTTFGVLFVQQVGVALTPTKIVIRISQPIKRA